MDEVIVWTRRNEWGNNTAPVIMALCHDCHQERPCKPWLRSDSWFAIVLCRACRHKRSRVER